jgi:uncharacterized protein (UPF0332 family)/predicted nucleotidyltransferase
MKKKKGIGKKLRKFSVDTRFKTSNQFRDKVLGLFKDYIKCVVVWGSVVRGDYTGKSDVDIYTIFDDTKMPLKKFNELRPKIDQDIFKIARELDPRLHPQPVISLTEFWDGVRNAHPLFYNIVREGFAVHDAGFFIPMRKLLEWGKFPATPEAAYNRIQSVPQRITRVKSIKTMMIAEDLYMAMTDSSQALLMFVGVGPPPPKQVAKQLREHFVNSKLLDDKYVKMYEKTLSFRKKVEHKEIKGITGKELDKYIEETEDFIKTFHKLLKRLEFEKKAVDVQKNYEFMIKASIAALKAVNKLPPDPKNMPVAFKKYLIESGLVNPHYSKVFDKVIEMNSLLKTKKLHEVPERDLNLTKEYVRRFISETNKIIHFKDKIDVDKMVKQQAEAKMEMAKQKTETAKEIKNLPESNKVKTKPAQPKTQNKPKVKPAKPKQVKK